MRISDWIQTCALPICDRQQRRADLEGHDGVVAESQDRQADAQAGEGEGALHAQFGKASYPSHGKRGSDLEEGLRPITYDPADRVPPPSRRSEEHTSELQSLLRISYAVFCLKKKKHNEHTNKPIL